MRARWVTLAAILLFGAAPILSVALSVGIADALGCRLNEGAAHPCPLWGTDLGGVLVGLFLAGWFAVVTVPLAGAALAIWALAWAVSAWRRRKERDGC